LRSADRKHDTSEPTQEEEEEEDSAGGRSRIWRCQERSSYVCWRKPYTTQWPPEPLIVEFASPILPTLSLLVSSTLCARENAYSGRPPRCTFAALVVRLPPNLQGSFAATDRSNLEGAELAFDGNKETH